MRGIDSAERHVVQEVDTIYTQQEVSVPLRGIDSAERIPNFNTKSNPFLVSVPLRGIDSAEPTTKNIYPPLDKRGFRPLAGNR